VGIIWPTYGDGRITAQLQREGWAVNHQRVLRIMGELRLDGKGYQRGRRTTDSRHAFPRYPNLIQDLQVVCPDQVWVADITYFRRHPEFVYLAVIIAVFTRGIRGWHLGRSLDLEPTLVASRQALTQHRAEFYSSDQGGPVWVYGVYPAVAACHVQISMAEIGQAWQNGFAERVIRTIEEEEVDLNAEIIAMPIVRSGRSLRTCTYVNAAIPLGNA